MTTYYADSSALVKHRQSLLSTPVRDGLLRDLQRDGRDQYWLIDVDQERIVRAIELTRRQKLRGYDVVHLTCAFFLQETLCKPKVWRPTTPTRIRDVLPP